MAEKVIMPQLGESVTEGTVTKWLVNAGDQVKKYESICEVTTDKVNAEVPCTFSGTISEILVAEGETVSVGAVICYMKLDAEEEAPVNVIAATHIEIPKKQVDAPVQREGKMRFSPAVLNLVQKHNLDPAMIQGTGAEGRITRKDILEIIEGKRQVAATIVQEAKVPAAPPSRPKEYVTEAEKTPVSPDVSSSAIPINTGDQIIPHTAVRKTIANRMLQSKSEVPHASIIVECDVTNLVRYRNEVKEEFMKKEGTNLTYLPFFIRSVVEALKEFPILNSQWTDDHIIIKKAINISIAVATDDALFVPVIKDADQKSILGLAKAADELAKKTREGKLTLEDMTGGTFTVNNTGSFGSILSTPIINIPQVAILSFEAIVKRPIVIDNMIAIRDMMNICLSLDHRVLDGLVCGRFLQSVKKKMESYGPDNRLF
ncbi:2-oxoisovalerate dehydrogenase E2 component (dihydrolipoyl transacylase) [Neobacillus niacini]|uniref:dihydrolipoamide acetyltransferase family protein n=1 Tax=Neobacillus niacini TaxID=86668 RepID=UPI00277E23C8|nr:dihydrolipoamide acetyltransferase family protein [Neobacillus niacini]MDQ1002648.1 2-oxoisovalerate dehydrogenase E2 component (dihydrolipoyl transacylase) [Neobacillus niacini]